MRRKPLGHLHCNVARAMDIVGDSWTLLIVRDALFDAVRFEDLQQSLGIPRTTLSSRLAALVSHGILERRQYQDSPTRHEYVITDKGRALHPVIVALLQWGDQWSSLAEPPITLMDGDTGSEIDAVYVDRRSGKPLSAIRIERRFNDPS